MLVMKKLILSLVLILTAGVAQAGEACPVRNLEVAMLNARTAQADVIVLDGAKLQAFAAAIEDMTGVSMPENIKTLLLPSLDYAAATGLPYVDLLTFDSDGCYLGAGRMPYGIYVAASGEAA